MNVVITAHRWEKGWELHRDGEPLTQISTLDRAVQQVRDYYDTIEPGVDHSGWNIEVSAEIAEARAATAAASEAAAAAARRSRQAVRHLREAGLSVTDSAAILGVSRGRISQLANS